MSLEIVNPAAWTARTGLGNVNRRPADDARSNNISRQRFQRFVEQLHALGPPPLAHFIRDIKRGGDIDALLEEYAALPADFVAAYGGDKFPSAVHVVDGGTGAVAWARTRG